MGAEEGATFYQKRGHLEPVDLPVPLVSLLLRVLLAPVDLPVPLARFALDGALGRRAITMVPVSPPSFVSSTLKNSLAVLGNSCPSNTRMRMARGLRILAVSLNTNRIRLSPKLSKALLMQSATSTDLRSTLTAPPPP